VKLPAPRTILRSASAGSLVLLVALLVHVLRQPERFSVTGLVLTPDQQAQLRFRRGAFAEAAQRFTDPYWQAVAYYRAGDFKQAAGMYTGLDTLQAAFNQATRWSCWASMSRLWPVRGRFKILAEVAPVS
jgi:hypothetical protein